MTSALRPGCFRESSESHDGSSRFNVCLTSAIERARPVLRSHQHGAMTLVVFMTLLLVFNGGLTNVMASPASARLDIVQGRGAAGVIGSRLGGNEYADEDEEGAGVVTRRQSTRQDKEHDAPVFITRPDAIRYLQKYGYLNCSSNLTSQSQYGLTMTTLGGLVQRRCTERMIYMALKMFQQRFHLDPVGRLDSDTRRLMAQRRCGNIDQQLQQQPQTKFDDALLTTTTSSQRRSSVSPSPSPPLTDPLQIQAILTGSSNSRTQGPASVRRSRGLFTHHGATADDYTDLEREMILTPNNRNHRHYHTHQLDQQPRRTRRSVRTSGLLADQNDPGSTRRRPLTSERLDRIVNNDEPTTIRWRLILSGSESESTVTERRAVLELAFRMWSEVAPIRFVYATSESVSDADIRVIFAKRAHSNCDKPFDGLGGEIAHSTLDGEIHLDDDEMYQIRDNSSSELNEEEDDGRLNLLKVAVHEIGHVLGLSHSNHRSSVMYPIYFHPGLKTDDLELSRRDRDAIQALYGVCKGSFDTIIDMVRRVESVVSGDEGTSHATVARSRSRYVFSTFFFRSANYWLYENSANRPRYGDPRHVTQEWGVLPVGGVDAVTQVVRSGQQTDDGEEFTIDTYFFTGGEYYHYNESTGSFQASSQRIEVDFFGAVSHQQVLSSYEGVCNETLVLNHFDAIFFNHTDSLLYIYKEKWVWLFDPHYIGRVHSSRVCPRKFKFIDLYTLSDPDLEPVTGDISTVYYSYTRHATFLLKDSIIYEVLPPSGTGRSSSLINRRPARDGRTILRPVAPWYQIWRDICSAE